MAYNKKRYPEISRLTELHAGIALYEQCMIDVKTQEEQCYHTVMNKLYTLKIRYNANKGFQKWLQEKFNKNFLQRKLCQDNLNGLVKLISHRSGHSNTDLGKTYESMRSQVVQNNASALEEIGSKLAQIDKAKMNKQYDCTFEIKYLRAREEWLKTENEYKSFEPLWLLWKISEPQSLEQRVNILRNS